MTVSTMRRQRLGLLVGLALLSAFAWTGFATAGTATTFNVANGGFTSWMFDGVANPPLTLVRGQTYQFALQDVPSNHPFYINTINTTGTGSQYTTGVTNNGATGNAVVQFTVPMGAPDLLHYNCSNHDAMNGPITVVADGIFAAGFD